jgi:hypothetical protein
MKTETQPQDMHFLACSLAQWAVTTPERDLRALTRLMDKDGFDYNLFLVPVSHDAEYQIKMYQPQVEGTKWLGFFKVKKGGRK